jgi:hypothetical protein
MCVFCKVYPFELHSGSVYACVFSVRYTLLDSTPGVCTHVHYGKDSLTHLQSHKKFRHRPEDLVF